MSLRKIAHVSPSSDFPGMDNKTIPEMPSEITHQKQTLLTSSFPQITFSLTIVSARREPASLGIWDSSTTVSANTWCKTALSPGNHL